MSCDYLILFGDLVGSTEVAVELSPLEFAKRYITSFHWAAYKAQEFINNKKVYPNAQLQTTIKSIKIVGDEVVSFTPLGTESDKLSSEAIQDLVASAVSFAYVTKLYWLASPYNLQRMVGGQFPRDISFGIHIGPADSVQEQADADVVSLHINVTKRIETHAREGTESRILVSYDVKENFTAWRKRIECKLTGVNRPPLTFASFLHPVIIEHAKGVPKRLKAFELAFDIAQLHELDTNILNSLVTTPDIEDDSAEIAAKILAEVLLPPTDSLPFQGYKGINVKYSIGNSTSLEDYIESWFKAIKAVPAIWTDEVWLVLNMFFMSCAMLRHSKINPSAKCTFHNTTRTIFSRLKTMIITQ